MDEDFGKREEDRRNVRVISEALREVFNENVETGKFIDVSRVPLICKSIVDMHQNIADIKTMIEKFDDRFVNQDQFSPVKTLVYGLTTLLLAGVIGSLLKIVLIK